jgi:acyl-coenzyme A synthetase/AMP-(fatty) acid ligase/pimeloyl-ACP methyl ester carboxylesterase
VRLPGLDPAWSRSVLVADDTGVPRRWHLLDNQAEPSVGTMLCVHGNPTWSYLWRRFLALAPPGWRVLAVDQLGMGWSERLSRPRRLAERIADLGALTDTLQLSGPVVIVAHDWGGPISLGWALAHRAQVAGLVLANTGVHHPPGTAPPGLIRLARTRALRDAVCVRTGAFVWGASALSRPRLPATIRAALASPYETRERRRAIGDFVADIPLEPDHPSRPALAAVASGLADLAEVPALLLWGPRDPVFTERCLKDLLDRLPSADVQRFTGASHLVTEDRPQAAEDAWRWVQDRVRATRPCQTVRPTPKPMPRPGLSTRREDSSAAVTELRAGTVSTTSFAELEQRIRDLAGGLRLSGVRAGDRVALLVPPGLDLTVAVYACWRVGAVIVVADAGLGLHGMAHALRSAGPDHVLGIAKALFAMSALRVPGRRIVVERLPATIGRHLGWGLGMAELEARGRHQPLPEPAAADTEAAVLFTSGATGPAKGVVYRHSQLRAQLDQVSNACRLTPDDRLVAAFAPFALYGPALGVGAVVPDMTVTSPGTLTARALADAVAAIEATVVFASPAALRNVVATAATLEPSRRQALAKVRLMMSAGAPVSVGLLRDVQHMLPAAELHTPYGMTEALPVADISLPEIEAAGPGNGVCVGRPLPGVRVSVSPLTDLGTADGDLTDQPDVSGEICVAAAHVKDRYDRLWSIERQTSRNPGWHRSGDVGHLDAGGRLWVEGRLVHVVTTAEGPVTPVGIEQRVETLTEVGAAAVVGVGPPGTQQVVVVVVPSAGHRRRPGGRLADPGLSRSVRAAAGGPVAAVLTLAALPVDIRHASKVDRARVARWSERLLAGKRTGRV